MPVYRLRPTTDDAVNWQLAANRGEVVVRAQSTGEARAIAALREAEAIRGEPVTFDTRVQASAFMQANLYTVVQDETGAFADDGPDGVLWWQGDGDQRPASN